MSTALITLAGTIAQRFGMQDGDGAELISVLKATAFKGPASDAQLTALMVVANQYGLNPFTREIYAFPDKNNGIVPVVGLDGWSRIINEHPQFDGMEYEMDATQCTCIIYRKDRSHPIHVTEFMDECKRDTGPWRSHPKRMLRHKATIQCARLAFGFAGIYDQDEAERMEIDITPLQPKQETQPKTLDAYPADRFATYLPKWHQMIQAGDKTADDIIAMVSSKASLSDEQKQAIRSASPKAEVIEGELVDDDFVRDMETAE